MLRNYLLISLRNLRKHLTYSLINIMGLGLGLAICLLLVTWIQHELSYDRFHTNIDRIYRSSLEYSFGGQTSKTNVSPTALLPALQKNFAEVETGVRIYNPSGYSPFIVRNGETVFQEGRFYYADSTLFDVFSFRLLQGSPDRALVEPRSVLLTQRMARKYFANHDPMGQVLQINNSADYKITGILQDPPSNSLLQFDFIASFSSLDAAKEQIWWSANYQTFVLLQPNTDIAALQDKTNNLVKKELASELTNPQDFVHYNFMPMADIYLRSNMDESETVSSINYVYGFGAIALIILLIACINYVNLATARAAERAKEVGIRKVVGAIRKQLFLQFIGESFVITLLGFIVAFTLAIFCLPLFNEITGKSFLTTQLFTPSFLLSCFVALIVISILSGAYPALAITAFRPVSVLKGNFKTSGRGTWLRQSLVTIQFSISIILIVGTLVITKQLRYIQSIRLGYNNDNVIVLPLDQKTAGAYGQLRSEFMKSGKVRSVGRATESPTKIRGGYSISLEGHGNGREMIVTAMTADTSFVPALGMELIAGRNFNEMDFKKYQADTVHAFILNESAIRNLSIDPDKAIGTKMQMNGRKGEIVGIVKDFHFSSLHSAIGPLALFNEDGQFHYMFVKLLPGNTAESLSTLKAVCRELIPHRPFEYEFLDQKYAALYSSEQRIGTITTVFASLAIIIACLGLFGLVAFSASQKTKEIGIRKVMGASAFNIVVLITRDYSRLIILSVIIGLPLSYWAINQWFLSSFVYRTPVGIVPFALAGLTCVLIALLTASYQSLKAALINPTQALRNE